MAKITGTNLNDILNAVVLGFGAEDNVIVGLDGDDTLTGGTQNDRLSAGAGNDQLFGGDGNDTLTGGLGADQMQGGLGDDIYVVDLEDNSSQIIENLGEGFDVVQSSVSWVLGDNFEQLILTGTSSINGTGSNDNNIILGNSAANTIAGAGGDDSLKGNGGDDLLQGNDDNDRLDGGLGNDRMIGGVGDDRYFVESTNDKVVENAGEGQDYVFVSNLTDYDLANHADLLFMGNGVVNGNGNALDNYIQGNANNNQINGNDGNDYLSGRNGNDNLKGSLNNDRLEGDRGNDVLSGGQNDDFLMGGDGSDQLKGDTGNDTLVGDIGVNAGVDSMLGGSGADTFVLGDLTQVFYDATTPKDPANPLYAVIQDFNILEGDRIQLHGVAADYVLKSTASGGTRLMVDLPGSNDRILAVLPTVNVATLNLTAPLFVYV
jgi:Ca2+-binding RTX toxin-like protein